MSESIWDDGLIDIKNQFKGEVIGGGSRLLSITTPSNIGDSLLINGDTFVRQSASNTLIEEQAARIAELQAELAREKKETERLDGAWNALHERMVKDNESHARYFEKSQARIHELFDAEAASQARLSEAVKVLERLAEGEMSDTGHTALREAAKAFIATLGGEK